MKNKRIPSILGTILLLFILFAGVWLTLRRTNTVSKASGDCTPTGVQVTNLTNKSADISFLTSATCSTSLTINGKTIPNFGDKLTTHYYRIDNLQASTLYQYYIIANGQQHQQPSFNFKTAPQVSTQTSTANLAWGKVVLASNKPSPNTIIYLNISGAWPLSALTDSDGQWHILLSNSFTQDKSAPFIPPTGGTEDILIYTPDGQLTQVENSLSKNDPVPNIIVGQGFTPQLGTGPGVTIPVSTSTPIILNSKLSITSPSEGESITSLRPDIFGVGKNNSPVNLSIDTDIIGKTTSKNDGSWNWSPDKNLSLGKHILTVTLGSELLQRNFTIIITTNATSPLSFSATPSATIVPTILPSTIPTVRTSKPSTKSGVPVTGNAFPFYLLILSSLFTLSFSLYFFNKDEK